MNSIKLRIANENDAEALLAIYSQYTDTAITFEYGKPSLEAFTERIKDISAFYPYIVCESDGVVIGYAYAHRQRERAAYRWNAESTVYIDNRYTGKGIGRRLYSALIEILTLMNIKNIYAYITVPNEKSEGLHYSMGFLKAGLYKNTGYKDGRWLDVLCLVKNIGIYGKDPAEVKPINEIPASSVRQVLDKYEK
ncbi:MAG: N-acetyltransferase family protein [Candidatus Cloacimonetes bacterium]|jgi:phosphinothricin acetyltransferase|nr:N-acetyltransferase family protein [Candidatus Cloacimonadota bacterium]